MGQEQHHEVTHGSTHVTGGRIIFAGAGGTETSLSDESAVARAIDVLRDAGFFAIAQREHVRPIKPITRQAAEAFLWEAVYDLAEDELPEVGLVVALGPEVGEGEVREAVSVNDAREATLGLLEVGVGPVEVWRVVE